MANKILTVLFANFSPIVLLAVLAIGGSAAGAAEPAVRRGEVKFQPADREQEIVPAAFRLPAMAFAYQQTALPTVADDVSVSLVTFPSPVVTPYPENNTVHCEYFCPTAPGKHPACVVLHILGGDFPLSRTFAMALAHRGVAALFVIMPYYGPRRPADAKARMVSADPGQTVAGMTQAVKDIRYAAAWLSAQDEVDRNQLGIFGISLGGITAALAGEVEPRFHKICPVLAGGGIQEILWDSPDPHMAEARKRWESSGGTRESLVALMKTIDPCSYGECARGREILMLNASHDEVIPKVCTEALWRSLGKPTIHWYDAGHYSAAWRLIDAIDQVTKFFQPSAIKGIIESRAQQKGG